jgi:hypothetical protein
MTLRRVFSALLFVQLFSIGVRETLDPDMWWHLRTGEHILAHGIPRHDVFSFTVSDHEWITHEWLSEVFMWAVYSLGGLPALSVAFAALSALSFWLVYCCSDGRPYLAGFVVVLAAFAAAPSFGVRPQMFTLLMVAAFTYVVEGYRKGCFKPRVLLVLPLLTILWVNLHGGYLLGIGLLLTYVAGDILEGLLSQQNDRLRLASEARRLAMIVVACLAASALNPNGVAAWTFPFGTLGSAFINQNIVGWRSPDFHSYIYWPFAVLVAVGIVALAMRSTRSPATDVLLLLGTAAAGFMSVYHIGAFGVVAMPIVTRSLARSAHTTMAGAPLHAPDERTMSGYRALANGAILCFGVLATLIVDFHRLSKNAAAVANIYPEAAVSFLEREGLAARHGYNSFAWGGYLIWHRIPVFVDGRNEVYGDKFLSYYLKAFGITDEWRKPLDEFDVAYVLVERSSPLGVLLATSGEWREAYADGVARVFTRGAGGAD